MDKLKVYEDSGIEFNVSNSNDELNIEMGDDFIILDDDDCSDDDVLEWAEENEYLDDDTFLLEDGSPDIDALRELKQEDDTNTYLENPPIYATPSGRAYQWFENLEFGIPNGIDMIDGYHPGNNSYGVAVKNIEVLVQIQQFLEENGMKVNFNFI